MRGHWMSRRLPRREHVGGAPEPRVPARVWRVAIFTVGPAGQPGTSIVLAPPVADPGVTDEERRTIVAMMAKGTYAGILMATANLDDIFTRLQKSTAEIVQEPTDQPYGVRDCAVRDPAGNLIRIQELP
jgi:catechol 2,3-dioxygenase-like lactoylglutathione lyase family enzyme